jgi:hypothetical protein
MHHFWELTQDAERDAEQDAEQDAEDAEQDAESIDLLEPPSLQDDGVPHRTNHHLFVNYFWLARAEQ